jgi:putative transposase
LLEARRLHAYLYNACLAHRRFEWRKNRKSIDYFSQQNALPAFRECWEEYKQLNLSSLQATVKRVDLAYNSFFKGIRKRPKFKSIRDYSGWTYPDGRQGFKVEIKTSEKYAVNHGWVILNDLNLKIKMRGRFQYWGKPTTCTLVYRPHRDEWYVSFTVKVEEVPCLFGSQSPLSYESMVAFDLGTATALTCFDGENFEEIDNPRFDREFAPKIRAASKALRRKRRPIRGQQKASNRWKKSQQKISRLKAKQSRVRQDWQHKVTTDLSSRYDIAVTEKLNVKGMTRKAKTGKRKRQKAGLNRSLLDVGFGTLNQLIVYKIVAKGGVHLTINTRKVKPSQRCPNCGKVHKDWANLSNRYHVCDHCGFEMGRDKSSVMVMWNVAAGQQPGVGTNLVSRRCSSSTDSPRTHTGGMMQLGQKKRLNSRRTDDVGVTETPPVYTVG